MTLSDHMPGQGYAGLFGFVKLDWQGLTGRGKPGPPPLSRHGGQIIPDPFTLGLGRIGISERLSGISELACVGGNPELMGAVV